MEKLKNILKPGHQEDDAKQYDTGNSSHTGHASPTAATEGKLTGEGSHLRGANTGPTAGSTITSDSLGHGTHSGGSNITADPHYGSSAGTTGARGTTGATGTHAATGTSGSLAMPGAFDETPKYEKPAYESGLSSSTYPQTSTTGSGVPHPSTTHQTYPSDASSTASIKSGVVGKDMSHGTSNVTSPVTSSSGYGSNTSKPLPNEPYGASTAGSTGTTRVPGTGATTGGHRDLSDPSFSNRTLHPHHPDSTPGHHYGRDVGAAAGAAALGAGATHEHGKHSNPTAGAHPTAGSGLTGSHHTPGSDLTGSGVPSTGRGFTGSHHTAGTGDDLTGTRGPTTGLTGASSAGPASKVTGTHGTTSGTPGATHGLGSGSTDTYGVSSGPTMSDLPDRTRGTGTSAGRSFPLGGGVGTGPHETSTANRLDPHTHPSESYGSHGTHVGTDHGLHTAGLRSGSLGAGGHRTHEDPARLEPSTSTTRTTQGHHGNHGTEAGLVGAGVGALGAADHSRHHPTTSSATTAPYGTTGSSMHPVSETTGTRDPTGQHHFGRDATLAGGTGTLGTGIAHEYDKHHNKQHGELPGTNPSKVMTSGGDTAYGKSYNKLSSGTPSGISTADPSHSSGLTSSSAKDPTTTSGTHSGHHLGRDAAVLGGTGAAAAGIGYEADKHSKHHGTGTGGLPGSSLSKEGQYYDAPSQSRTIGSEPHHLGRDAAVAGGTGVAGTGTVYEADKLRHGTHGTTGYDGHDSSMPGQHSTNKHHLGRDANLTGGLGGTGAGAAYEYEKHRGHNTTSSTRDPAYQSNVAKEPLYSSTGRSGTVGNTTSTTGAPDTIHPSGSQTVHRHPGHDALTEAAEGSRAGGVGTVGGAQLSHGSGVPVDTTRTGPATKTVGPHGSNVANVMDPRVLPEPAKQKEHTTVGPHHSDTLNKIDPRVTADPLKAAEKQQASGHHPGTATAGGVGAGTTGVGAYEAEKHHGHHGHSAGSGYGTAISPTTHSTTSHSQAEPVYHGSTAAAGTKQAPNYAAQSGYGSSTVPGSVTSGTTASTSETYPSSKLESQQPYGGSTIGSTGSPTTTTSSVPSSEHESAMGAPEKKDRGLSSLFHRNQPSKLHKDPPS